jgi:hypothetical protein
VNAEYSNAAKKLAHGAYYSHGEVFDGESRVVIVLRVRDSFVVFKVRR